MTPREVAARACPFCEIIAGRAPGVLRREWDDAIALIPLRPVTPGHTLIIPKAHVADYAERPDVTAALMHRAAEYAPAGASNLITSRGTAATQTVWHLHVHVVPRHAADGLALPWDADAALAAIADHPGLAEVLAEHPAHNDPNGRFMWCTNLACPALPGPRTTYAAHLADVVRAWLRGEA